MAIQWTGPMIKRCAEVYSNQGAMAAIELTGASYNAVKIQMSAIGAKCLNNSSSHLVKEPRRFYGEDVALMFEMFCSGVEQKIIAEYFDATISSIKSVFSNARKNGFDAYPMRNK